MGRCYSKGRTPSGEIDLRGPWSQGRWFLASLEWNFDHARQRNQHPATCSFLGPGMSPNPGSCRCPRFGPGQRCCSKHQFFRNLAFVLRAGVRFCFFRVRCALPRHLLLATEPTLLPGRAGRAD